MQQQETINQHQKVNQGDSQVYVHSQNGASLPTHSGHIKNRQNEELEYSDSNDNDHQSSDQNMKNQGYQIMGSKDNKLNQMLMVKCQPGSVLWTRGRVHFSNRKIQQKKGFLQAFRIFLDQVGIKPKNPTLLQNTSHEAYYFMLSLDEPYNGKILTLAHEVYKQTFYINMNNLLTINYDSSQYTLQSHPKLSNLKLINRKTNTMPYLFVSLQSKRDCNILEKSLGVGQTLYLSNSVILAMSTSVVYDYDLNSRNKKLVGPGFVFFQPSSRDGQAVWRINLVLILIIILYGLLVLLKMIE